MGSDHRERRIMDLGIGDTGWTSHWAIWMDRNHDMRINLHYPAHPTPRQDAQLLVEREGDGFRVGMVDGDRHIWRHHDRPPHFQSTPDDYAEVVDFVSANLHYDG